MMRLKENGRLRILMGDKMASPNPKIDKTYTRMWIRGEWKEPGDYGISKGEQVVLRTRITNKGDKGMCRILIYDDLNRKEIGSFPVDLDPNETFGWTKGWYFPGDQDVVVYAQWYDAIRDVWVTTDSYG